MEIHFHLHNQLTKADIPAEINHPSRKITLEIKPGRHETNKQTRCTEITK